MQPRHEPVRALNILNTDGRPKRHCLALLLFSFFQLTACQGFAPGTLAPDAFEAQDKGAPNIEDIRNKK